MDFIGLGSVIFCPMWQIIMDKEKTWKQRKYVLIMSKI